jgi:ABC-type sugar transport system ATPase subunit
MVVMPCYIGYGVAEVNNNILLKCEKLSIKFGYKYALRDVSIEVHRGEIVGLAGHNGAGKSVLVNTIGGNFRAESGKVFYENKEVRHLTPHKAKAFGYNIVPQELNVSTQLSVADNIFIGTIYYSKSIFKFVRRKYIYHEASRLLKEYFGVDVDASKAAGNYDTIVQRLIQIVRCLITGAKVIVFDETTAGLTVHERERLFEHIGNLSESGVGIIYISHILPEMLELCDRVVVLREGSLVATHDVRNLTMEQLVGDIIGRNYQPVIYKKEAISKDVLLEVKRCSTENGRIKDLNITLHKGEILGIYGLRDQGQVAMMEALVGAEKTSGGEVALDGKAMEVRSPGDSIRSGITYLAERGIKTNFPTKNIYENLIVQTSKFIDKTKWIHPGKEKAYSSKVLDDYSISGLASIERRITSLSGGNIQKVLLARQITVDPKVMIFIEPTQGIDIGVKGEVKQLLLKMARQGKGIIVVTSEIDDVFDICNNVLIVRKEKIVCKYEAVEANRNVIMAESAI